MKTIVGSALVLCATAYTAAVAAPAVPAAVAAGASQQRTSGASPTASGSRLAARQPTAEQETVFWQSIVNSTDPADFEAYLEEFPNGVFRRLAQNRLSALRAASNDAAVSGAAAAAAAGVDAPRRPGEVFRDCAECPEMVVLPGGLAMGRYEVTVGEYRAFASATGGGAGGGCGTPLADGDSWRDPGFAQTDRHPVTCVSWDDAQAYVSWLSRRSDATYRLPMEAEWERSAAGSQAGCSDRFFAFLNGSGQGTCLVGSHGTNAAGLSDMVGNVGEWMSDCSEGDCRRRVFRGGSWLAEDPGLGARNWDTPTTRYSGLGFRVSRTLE